MLALLKQKFNLGSVLGFIGVIYLVLSRFLPINQEVWNQFVQLGAGVLVGIGVFTNTGEYVPLTKESILSKLSSPVLWSSMAALIVYFSTVVFGQQTADLVTKITESLFNLFFGVAVYNNPNSRETL